MAYEVMDAEPEVRIALSEKEHQKKMEEYTAETIAQIGQQTEWIKDAINRKADAIMAEVSAHIRS